MSGPLKNLKVIEMTGLGPCPLAGQLLADLGAEVIVIDRNSAAADPTDINRRNKRSIALNLKSAQGLKIAKQLIATADILIEGFRPGVMEKLGLSPEILHKQNQGLIYGRMTGWGQTGPLAQTAGHDINYLSITGALNAIGKDKQAPIPPLNLVADYGGGTMFLLFGVLSAVFERSQSSKGQVVDAAMVDGVPAMMGLIHSWFAQQSWTTQRESNLLDGAAPFYRCYETADEKFISVGPLEPHFFTELVKLSGLDEAEIATQYQQEKWPDKRETYQTIFKTKTREQWMQIFDSTDACVAPVLDFDEVETHPHNAERGNFIRVGGVLQAAPAPRFGRTATVTPKSPKAPGADGQNILRELGYQPDDIDTLKNDGAIT
ncbi:CaiB/BaiF CoA transferase family protein [Leucothrix pacifica]|uniref:Carnitine dehydratase n=1 Tax=Leucothrix pacifica TaxID=1247513 RepID=A0A317CL55_9GAMM|nr:CaiB/BaiF CoA-transferase family protein [Leucothrix pacifica]PWQ99268.1 carnitine dehydratase [Leucothrix pacifica]